MTKKRLKVMPQARADLKADRNFIARRSPFHAELLASEIAAKLRWIADVDFTGVPREDIAPGLRAFPFRDRCIYYRRYEDRVVIVRILHGAQDTETQSFSG